MLCLHLHRNNVCRELLQMGVFKILSRIISTVRCFLTFLCIHRKNHKIGILACNRDSLATVLHYLNIAICKKIKGGLSREKKKSSIHIISEKNVSLILWGAMFIEYFQEIVILAMDGAYNDSIRINPDNIGLLDNILLNSK